MLKGVLGNEDITIWALHFPDITTRMFPFVWSRFWTLFLVVNISCMPSHLGVTVKVQWAPLANIDPLALMDLIYMRQMLCP